MVNNINDIEQEESVQEGKLVIENSIHLEVSGDARGGNVNGSDINSENNKDDERNENIDAGDIEDDEDSGLPIDRGWAWVVAIAVHMNQLLKIGYSRSMDILFIEFLRVYKTSATVTTLTSGVMAGVFAISAFVSMQVLVGRIPNRYIVIMGGLLSSLGIMASAFATDITQLIILQGLFIGVGNSMIHGPALVLVGKYFKNKRGLGLGLANSGTSIGAIVFPLLATYLLDEYGLRGTLLIFGAMQLNIVAFALLMRPIESFSKVQHKKSTVSDPKLQLQPKSIQTHHNECTTRSGNPNDINIEHNVTLSSVVNTTRSGNPNDIKFEHNVTLSTRGNVGPRTDTFIIEDDAASKNGEIKKRSLNPCANLDFSVMKKPHFWLLAVVSYFSAFLTLFLRYYPAYVTDEGTSKQDAATFISIAGGIDFFARLGFGHFSDLGYVKPIYICVFTLVISAINCHMVTFYTSYGLQLLGVICHGLLGGIQQSLTPILLMDFLGAAHLAKSLGFIMIVRGGAASMDHPIAGALKDLTGSYSAAYHAMGSALLIPVILLLFEPLFSRCVKGRETEAKSNTNNNENSV